MQIFNKSKKVLKFHFGLKVKATDSFWNTYPFINIITQAFTIDELMINHTWSGLIVHPIYNQFMLSFIFIKSQINQQLN